VYGFGLGHNIPFFGVGPGAPKLWTLVLVPTAVAAVTLVAAEARLARQPEETAPSSPRA